MGGYSTWGHKDPDKTEGLKHNRAQWNFYVNFCKYFSQNPKVFQKYADYIISSEDKK